MFPYNGDPQFMVSQMYRNLGDPQGSKQPETKPRLSKDEVQLLENEFKKNNKPTSQRKREIADMLGVEPARINNWFQNRRAKAKQIKRRETDPNAAGDVSPTASSPSEQQDDSLVSEHYESRNHSQTPQISSAAFPTVEQNHLPIFPIGSDCSLVQSTPPSNEEYPSPQSLVFQSSSGHEFSYAPALNGYLAAQAPLATYTAHTSPHSSGSIDGDHYPASQDFEQPLRAFMPYTTAMNVEPVMAPIGSYHSALLSVEEVPQLDEDLMAASTCEAQSPASMIDARFKSPPPPTNLAIRRNKGTPATLDSTTLRGHPFGPRTGIDMGKRIEGPAPIRRIASANGLASNRIQKAGIPPAPRSPLYYERNKEIFLQSLQTAGSSGPIPLVRSVSNDVSPVTPSEALMAIQHNAADAMVMGGSSSDDEQVFQFGLAGQHPFIKPEPLKTPPGTPGFHGMLHADHQMPMEMPWSYVSQDEAVLTPSLASYGSDEFPMMPSAPVYIMNSQPSTPSLNQPLANGYFSPHSGFMSQSEYTFPGEGPKLPGSSAKSSPGRTKSKLYQFTQNVTPEDFSGNDK